MSKEWYEEHLFHRIKRTIDKDTGVIIDYDENMNPVRIKNNFKEVRYKYNNYSELIYVSEISNKNGNVLIEEYYDREGRLIYRRFGNHVTDGKNLDIVFGEGEEWD